MTAPGDEGTLLRSVALQNARAIFLARQRAEEDLKQAKEALERRTQELASSLALISATLESTTDGILVTDSDGNVTGFNQRFVRMWKVSPGVMASRNHREVQEAAAKSFEDPAMFFQRIQEIYDTSPPETYDLLEPTDGRLIERYSTVQSISGRNAGRVWSFRDVTESKRTERTIRFLADASAELVVLTDDDSTLQRVASLAVPAFADWCSADLLESDGSLRRVAVAHSEKARVVLADEFLRPDSANRPAPIDLMRVIRTGKVEWTAALASPRPTRQSQLVRELGWRSAICVPLRSRSRVLGTMTFATGESGRSYDATDAAVAEDLALRIVISLENADLLSALRESDRRKDEFLAILAHELRNPLAPIRNAVLVQRAPDLSAERFRWTTDVIDRQAQHMSRLVDDLLDLSRITEGKIELRKERVDLATVIDHAIEDTQHLFDDHGHKLSVSVPAEPILVECDPLRLSQVLANLLSNAAKYMDEAGKASLQVDLRDGEVQIRVKDDGIGITKEMLPRVFDMFTQVDRHRERAQGGLGIGLTLVQRLVEMHGGQVEARSAGAGQGSEFVVRLIRQPEEVVDEESVNSPLEARSAAGAKKVRRILVVDDNLDAADSLGMLLSVMGNEVRSAHDGLEAVNAAEEFDPDLILMDIGLPKLDGHEAARRIRQQANGKRIVMVALTGWGREEDRRRSTEAGFDFHLTKPVELAQLRAVLAGAIRS